MVRLSSAVFVLAILTAVQSAPGFVPAQTQTDEWTAKRMLKAAQQEDLKSVEAAIKAGVGVNEKTEYGATALFFACDRGNRDLVKLLLDAGADPNVQDTFYNATPLTWAMQKQHKAIVAMLLAKGGKGADGYLIVAVESGDPEFAKRIIETGSVSEAGLLKARDAAVRKAADEQYSGLPKLFEGLKLPEPEAIEKMSPELLQRYAGKYQAPNFTVTVELEEDELKLGFNDAAKSVLDEAGPDEFLMGATGIRFEMDGDQVVQLKISFGTNELIAKPIKSQPEASPTPEPTKPEAAAASQPEFGPSSKESLAADLAVSSVNWPSFRGNEARGVAEGQKPPIEWAVSNDSAENKNLKWKIPIPGLGLSCPSIWGNRIYLTSAYSDQADDNLKIGLYGDVDSVEEDFEFDFNLYCVDKASGEILWQKTATTAKPKVKRHTKSSHANPTVATDGTHVIAFFGSEGLYCYSSGGELIWKKDLGFLDSGWFYDAGYQWGFGSSPIIWDGKVIVQCDIQSDSFVAAFDVETGEEVWRTMRDEIPSWATPTVHQFGDTPVLLTHATKAARGYDARDGKLLWSLARHSEIVTPTPIVAHDLIFITSGYSPIQPIYAIRPSAVGDITPAEDTFTNEFIPWSKKRGGPYMPTPIVYGDYLYCCSNRGILDCYEATTGREVYKQRLSAPGGSLSFTASPLAGDGHLYLPSEDGRVLVVKAGPDFELVATNPCGESILATPAISEGAMYLRTQKSLIAVGE